MLGGDGTNGQNSGHIDGRQHNEAVKNVNLNEKAVDDTGDLDATARLSRPIHEERHVRIICIGAGASGLLMAYKLQRHFQNFSMQIYDKNTALGGTWHENRYPGCACDVPSHTYTWSFEPKLDWSCTYPPRAEIFDYFDGFADKYNLKQYIKLQHSVEGATWETRPGRGGYKVQVRDHTTGALVEDWCDILINASGILNNWKWPNIPGLFEFKGKVVHTANWDDTVELDGKRVGVLGNGSTAIQVVPTIRERCAKLTNFIRTPTWILPTLGLRRQAFTREEADRFANTPGELTSYRKGIEAGLNENFGIWISDTDLSKGMTPFVTNAMRGVLQDEELEKKLLPDYRFGCRRISPGPGYLEALKEPNVEVSVGGVVEVTESGCVTKDGQHHELDVLICATGFDTTYRPRFPIIGSSGDNLQDKWAKEPQSYMGLAAAGFPNLLMLLGPNCPIGNGPVLSGIEAQADWICKMVDRYQTTNILSFAPKEAAVRDFTEFKDQFMTKTVWTDSCRSWYQDPTDSKKIFALWPGSTMHYAECLKHARFEDFDVEYAGNRFAWLGNGFAQAQADPTCDLAYYVREADDDGPISTAGQRRALTKSGTIKEQKVTSWATGSG